MRTRHAFRPMLETMSSRLVLSSFATDPMAPIVIPDNPRPTNVDPYDPIVITDPAPGRGMPYAGADTRNPTIGTSTLNA